MHALRQALWCTVIATPIFFSIPANIHPQTRVPTRSVDEEAFRDHLSRALSNRVMGYAFVLADRRGIMAKASGGWAQAPNDGRLAMKTTIPAQIGSVAKVASGIALLDLLEANLAPGQSIDQKLDTSIRFYLPDKWITSYFNRSPNDPPEHIKAVNRLTLRNLLNHRSGLKEFNDGGAHGTKVARTLANGPNPLLINRGPISYLNENITLLQYIIPAIAYRSEVDAIERRNAGKPLRDYNSSVAKEYGALFERYMHEVFFPKSLAPIAPTCRPKEDVPNGRYAKEYRSRNDQRGHTEHADFCRPQGSWLYSAQDLAQLARTIEFSTKFIEHATRDLLYQPAFPNRRLIYWRLYSQKILGKESGGSGLYRAHGGSTGGGARACLIRLPFGYIGVGIINSPELTSIELTEVLLDAFVAATRDWQEWNIDRPGNNIKHFLIDPDPAMCQAACDDLAECDAWTYVKPGVQHPQKAQCWLKSKASPIRESACCNSGVKGVDYATDRPGSNYSNFPIGKPDLGLCRTACGLDTTCKAWAFVKPGVQGEKAMCWLKNQTPSTRRSPCCASGLSPK